MNKTILILGAGEGQVPLISRAKGAGWRTIVASPLGDYPGFALADECRFVDISDKEGVLDLARKDCVSAIATDQTDVSVSTVQYVANALGLPHIECVEIEHFRDKSLMREICSKKGIATIPYCITNELGVAMSFYESLSNKVAIVKPVDSQGSRGVSKVQDLEEVKDAFFDALSYSKSRKIIIELYVDGKEVEVDSVVKDGEVICTLIGDVNNFNVKNTFSAYERIYPTRKLIPEQNTITEYNEKILKALGLITGWTHGEYIVTDNNEVYLIEVGARGGGNYIGSDILRTMIGVGTDEMAFNTALGDDSFYERVRLRNKCCAYKCFYLPVGVVHTCDIDADLLNFSWVVNHNLNSIKVGALTRGCLNKTTRYTIVLEADNQTQLRERLSMIERRIKIEVKTNEGLKGAIWR